MRQHREERGIQVLTLGVYVQLLGSISSGMLAAPSPGTTDLISDWTRGSWVARFTRRLLIRVQGMRGGP
jgi:hypothetical protein